MWNDKVLRTNTEANWLHERSATARRAHTGCDFAPVKLPRVHLVPAKLAPVMFDLGIAAEGVVWAV